MKQPVTLGALLYTFILLNGGCGSAGNLDTSNLSLNDAISNPCSANTTQTACTAQSCTWLVASNQCIPSASPTCSTQSYSCGSGSLTSQVADKSLVLTNTLGYQCGPANSIFSICESTLTPQTTSKINGLIQADVCTAMEYTTASYFCENVFNEYKKGAFTTTPTIITVFNDNSYALDWTGNAQCTFLGICSVPLNSQYFMVDDGTTIWISIRGTVFVDGQEANLANAVLDGFAALTNIAVPITHNGISVSAYSIVSPIFTGSLSGIKLHSGFLGLAEAIYEGLKQNLNKTKPIKITGHSLGAGAAAVLALILLDQGYNVQALYDFGQPTVTDNDGAVKIAAYLKTKANFNHIRFIQGFDAIPFSAWTIVARATGISSYAHFGDEVRLGLGPSSCLGTGCYTPTQLDKQTGFAYVTNGTLGYAENTGPNVRTEHSTSIYGYRLYQSGCKNLYKDSNLAQILTQSCGAIVTDDTDSPNTAKCTQTLKCP